MLSGWSGFNPPDPSRLETMTNWYHPETVRFLREAGINVVWVTFSNGFSLGTEKAEQEQLRWYIDDCHRQGIRVMAYESASRSACAIGRRPHRFQKLLLRRHYFGYPAVSR
jgi:hypothetical protein